MSDLRILKEHLNLWEDKALSIVLEVSILQAKLLKKIVIETTEEESFDSCQGCKGAGTTGYPPVICYRCEGTGKK